MPRQSRTSSYIDTTASPPQLSIARQIINLVGCCIAAYVFFYGLGKCRNPLTVDIIISILLAEYNRWTNHLRRQKTRKGFNASTVDSDREKQISGHRLGCIAAIVGYREDPVLFKQCLKSYLNAPGCRFVLVGIDGDAEEDGEMVEVFQQVFQDKADHVHLAKPLAQLAFKYQSENLATDEETIQHCCMLARSAIEAGGVSLHGPESVTRLCVSQPHMHKKGIMFTNFIFSLVLSDELGLEYLWTSDSDSWIVENALLRTVATMAEDPKIGGASASMFIHNADDTVVAQMGNGVYLSEVYVQRSFTGAASANDCQSGPAASFRVAALPNILIKWYNQNFFGHFMITNEDRHLTTRLLLDGWKVIYVSDVYVATECPKTLQRWLQQQVRWARAIHFESFHRPQVYLKHSPILFYSTLRREVVGLLVPLSFVLYVCTGRTLVRSFSPADLVTRIGWIYSYLWLRNPYRGKSWSEWLWIFPAMLFYRVPLPAIHLWSWLTVLDDSWGTPMRSSVEVAKKQKVQTKIREIGWIVLWMAIFGGAAGRSIASMLGAQPLATASLILVGGVVSFSAASCWLLRAD
ncbi:hyaluronan synthase [Teratosphaeria nubilosa]|uniref:Hyaluronan synthase n=1 Tax=Teratosphaeria nubilosa TaxID=161662 RepID=A0A6G1LKZ1_9PEZI|nr:hyaluronan synthase [Teratosphaeria nubilosa]